MSAHPSHMPLLVAYDRAGASDLLRSWTAQSLLDALRGGHFGADLTPGERAELDDLLTAWVQRALGGVFLRDALIVDGQRGPQVFGLICAGLTRARVVLPPELADLVHTRGQGDLSPTDLANLGVKDPGLARLAQLAGREGYALALLDQPGGYPPPADLSKFLPRPIPAHSFPGEAFAPPTGARRNIAVALAVAGMALMIIPMLGGSIPQHPAGLPLALITLALMVGIRAGWAGFIGSLCLWLVANLPGFRHDTSLIVVLPSLPLLALGLTLLILDRRVRALWIWIRKQIRW
jgi:hypothetical protein